MSVIAVTNLPKKLQMPQIVTRLAWIIKGDFEALNCVPHGKLKTCYIQLSERLDPQLVVEKLRETGKYKAFVSNNVPDIQPSKRGKIPMKVRRSLGIAETNPGQVFLWTHVEILTEMQSKFTGLFNLSRKTGHRLLETLARKVMERLKKISDSNPDVTESCFRFTSYYRRLHPHFGDFQLILSTLHDLQDAAGVPRAQLAESDLTELDMEPYMILKIPYKVIDATCRKYSAKIIKKAIEYIKDLDDEMKPTDSDKEVAQKRIRTELKKISPYLPQIVHQVIANHFQPQKFPFHRIRIYGEPFLPQKNVLAPFLKKFGAVKIMRSDRMFNKIQCNIPCKMIGAIQQKDGTLIGEAKLIIRASDVPMYRIPNKLLDEARVMFRDIPKDFKYPRDDLDDMDDEEAEDEIMADFKEL